VRMLDHDGCGIYNIAGEGAVPWSRAIATSGARPLPLPTWLAYPGVRVLAKLQTAFPAHLMDFFRYPVIVSDQAIRRELGWAPRVNVVDTLRSIDDIPADAGSRAAAFEGSRPLGL